MLSKRIIDNFFLNTENASKLARIRIAYKNEFANVQDSFNAVEEILQATGRDV